MAFTPWDNPMGTSGFEFIEYAAHPLTGECILVAGLRRGQHVQRVDSLVLDQRLLEHAVALNDVHEVVNDTPLAPHDQIEVAQSDVKVDHGDALATLRKSACNAGGCGGFTNSSFTRGHDDNFCQCGNLL